MNEYEKLGLLLVIVVSPMWVNHMDGFRGLVLEMFLVIGVTLFLLGHRMSRK